MSIVVRGETTASINNEAWQLWENTRRDLKQLYEKVKQYPLIGIFFLLVVVLLIAVPHWQVSLSGITNVTEKDIHENQNRATLAQIIGGFALLFGLYFTWGNLILARESNITERFTQAVGQLGAIDKKGNPAIEIRLGGIYALERIANESGKDYWQIMEILTAYIRKNSYVEVYKENEFMDREMDNREIFTAYITKVGKGKREVRGLPFDIQAILTVIKRRKNSYRFGENNPLDLSLTNLHDTNNLSGANLSLANFSLANLSNANLYGTDIFSADLSGANLSGANLSGANLSKADLSYAYFPGVQIPSRADLRETDLSAIKFFRAHLFGANLSNANLSNADIFGANLSYADLSYADLSYADLSEANLSNANLFEANLYEADLRRAKNLTISQLLEVKTLCNAKLDGALEILLKNKKETADLFKESKDKP